MKIDLDLIKKISTLSMLKLTDKECKKYTKDFQEILTAFSVLDKIDVSETPSSFVPIDIIGILREDKISDSITQDIALKFSKSKENGFFIGPKTIE